MPADFWSSLSVSHFWTCHVRTTFGHCKPSRISRRRKGNSNFEAFLTDPKSKQNLNSSAPEVGDLIIYPKSAEQRFGHVSVVINVNLENQYVDIAE